ncbi:MAG: hypothetical protein ACE5IM_09060 [Nitrospinota bacterium]
MPKDEFDPEDPMELMGMALPDPKGDTLRAMAECFVEEFLWMGQEPAQIFNTFLNPAYRGPHLVYRREGERYVRELIEAVCARWQGETGAEAASRTRNGAHAEESGGREHA